MKIITTDFAKNVRLHDGVRYKQDRNNLSKRPM